MKHLLFVFLVSLTGFASTQPLTKTHFTSTNKSSFSMKDDRLVLVFSHTETQAERLQFIEQLTPAFKLTKALVVHSATPEEVKFYLRYFNQLEDLDIYSYSNQKEVQLEIVKPLHWFTFNNDSVERLSISFQEKDSLKILGIDCPLVNTLELNASFFSSLGWIDLKTPKLTVINSFKAPKLYQAVVHCNFQSWPTFLVSENNLTNISITNLTNIAIPSSLAKKVKKGFYSDLEIQEKGKVITTILSTKR